jgi:Ca2+-transporting ATPase
MPQHAHQGLTSFQVQQLSQQYGPNKLPEGRKRTRLYHFLVQFKSPLIYILVVAGALTYFLKDYKDSLVIFAAVLVNTALGYYQERKAEKALEALRSMLNPSARAIRDGQQSTIAVSELVPGDIVILGQGDKVPGDGILLESVTLGVNEAILTGESSAVTKQCNDRVYMGSTILTGHGVMEVKSIGLQTKMGSIAHEIDILDDGETPLQKRLNRFAGQLALCVIGLAILICFIGLHQGHSFTDIFSTSVALAVAAIPEGMTVSLTAILAIGMQRILKKKALVRRLVAAETLGAVTVIATDKTGTLTEGLMRVTKVDLVDKKLALKVAVYANNLDDPLEIALWEWAQKEGIDVEALAEKAHRQHEKPFSSDTKFMSVTINGKTYLKGAPEIVLKMCKLSKKKQKEHLLQFSNWADKGLRLIGFAYQSSSKDPLEWVGVLGMEDPVRKNIDSVMSTCHGAGIRIMMITGDYAGTARAVWAQIMKRAGDIEVIDGKQLEKITDAELKVYVQTTEIFARVSPTQKLRIVEALRSNGEVVALIGDGVNDAPALKEAHIGIVVGSASDVAKETADIVLLDSNFKTIVSAIDEGRGMYSSILKVIRYLMSGAFAEILLVIGSIALGIPIPLTAGQILWINIVTDSLPAIALTIEPKERNLLKHKPINPSKPLIDLEMKTLVALVSGITGILCLILFKHYYVSSGLDMARTMVFTALSIGTLAYIFSIRSMKKSLFSSETRFHPALVIAVGIGLLLQFGAIYHRDLQEFLETSPLVMDQWFVIGLFSVTLILLIEISKFVFSRLYIYHR